MTAGRLGQRARQQRRPAAVRARFDTRSARVRQAFGAGKRGLIHPCFEAFQGFDSGFRAKCNCQGVRPWASAPSTMLRMVPLPRADAQGRKGALLPHEAKAEWGGPSEKDGGGGAPRGGLAVTTKYDCACTPCGRRERLRSGCGPAGAKANPANPSARVDKSVTRLASMPRRLKIRSRATDRSVARSSVFRNR